MLKTFLTATLLLVPGAAVAQLVTAPLRALLEELPAAMGNERVEIGFGDLALARQLDLSGVEGVSRDPAFAQLRALSSGGLGRMVRDPVTDWRATVGFGLSDLEQFLDVTPPPANLLLLRLAPGVTAGIPDTLAGSGYSRAERGGLTAWTIGDEDFRIDIRARNPDDPLRAGMGRSARVVIDDDLIRQAPGWPVLLAMRNAAAAPLSGHADVAALLEAVDRQKGAGAMVRAMILTDADTLGLVDPLRIVMGDASAPAGRSTRWGMALMADLTDGPRSTGVLVLTLTLSDSAAETGTAEALRERVEAGWSDRPSARADRSFAELAGGPARVTVEQMGNGRWVLTLVTATAPTESFGSRLTRNAGFSRLMDGAMMRDLVFLHP